MVGKMERRGVNVGFLEKICSSGPKSLNSFPKSKDAYFFGIMCFVGKIW